VKLERVRCADGTAPTYIVEGTNYDLTLDGKPLAPQP